MKILVLMAGDSKAFASDIYKFPKFLLEVNGKPLIQHLVNSFSSLKESDFIFIVKKSESQKYHIDNVIKLLLPDSTILKVEGKTKGAACSALFAVDYIKNEEPLLITNGDQILDVNYVDFMEKSANYEASTIIFDSVHPRWSYVKLDNKNEVIEASEKRPISNNATAGTYLYKKGKYFVDATTAMIRKDVNVDGLYYICPTFNEMILKNKIISTYKIKQSQYHQITNPQELKSYENFIKEKRL
jgi:NDP-sugar pyrophosphorylase family protein